LTGTGTGKTLAAIAGTITGASAAFSKNILFDQSITIFVGRMDQLRKAKLDQIEAKLKTGSYTLAEAYRDIQDYGYQGSLDAAFADVAHETKPAPTPSS
jgi:enhancing lycopene biosynthesis protein 2